MGTIKNINGRHLGTQKRSRRDGSNTWKICTKKIQMNQITTMVSHQSQTFWITKSSEPQEALLLVKLGVCDEIPIELFKILKDNAIKMLHSICQQIWKIQQWPQDWKSSILIPIPKKSNAKECPNHWTTALISHAREVMLKIRLYANQELPDVQAGLRKGKGIRDQIVNIYWIIE